MDSSIVKDCSDNEKPTNPTIELSRRNENKRKRIRRLVEESASKRTCLHIHERRPRLKFLFIVTFAIGFVCALVLGRWTEFLEIYNKNYQQIINGKIDYCEESLNSAALSYEIAKQHGILNQADAMQQLELGMRNKTNNFKAFAVVGPSGVGKSMWARALVEHFAWKENVRLYAWNMDAENVLQKLNIIRSKLINKFGNCGVNLLVIESLPLREYNVVNILNEIIKKLSNVGGGASKRVLVVYIFNMNTIEDAALNREHYDLLQSLSDTRTINFRSFGIEQLKDCVRQEAVRENITLTKSSLDDIIASINPTMSGCKMVHKKVLLYKNV